MRFPLQKKCKSAYIIVFLFRLRKFVETAGALLPVGLLAMLYETGYSS